MAKVEGIQFEVIEPLFLNFKLNFLLLSISGNSNWFQVDG